jgi:hypothetical protein
MEQPLPTGKRTLRIEAGGDDLSKDGEDKPED